MSEISQRLHAKAAAAVHALEALYEEALRASGGEPPTAASDAPVALLSWSPATRAVDLAAAAVQAAAEVTAVAAPIRPGHLYCFSCASSDCAHSQPPQPGYVFAGYSSTGTPCWQEFFNVLLEMEDSRTEKLFSRGSNLLLARVVGRRRLVDAQLVSFGRNSLTYWIWGQLIAGYFHLETLRAAVTVQVVESPDHILHLQVITDSRLLEALANAPADERSPFHRVYDVLTETAHKVREISTSHQQNRSRKAQQQTRNAVFDLLRHMAQSIERKGRQQQRRTSHAEIRAQQQRPVHKAHDDVRVAGADDFFRDVVRDNVAVIGRGGRAHIFSREGRHITSFALSSDELEKRVARRRYQLLSDPDSLAFPQLALASCAD